MPALSLPLTFLNSFWTQDYRRGLEVLYDKLEQGVEENAELITFVRARAAAEHQLSALLVEPERTGSHGAGFATDDGASLLMAFRCLQAESTAQGKAHEALANELDQVVADPFDEWSHAHRIRVTESRNILVDGWILSYEEAIHEVSKLRNSYLAKTKRADEVEDDAKFSGNYAPPDPYTMSPKLSQIQRSADKAEHIAKRLAELKGETYKPNGQPAPKSDDETDEEGPAMKFDKGKGKALDEYPASPPPLSPPLPPMQITPNNAPLMAPPPLPILLAGLAMSPSNVSTILMQAQARMHLRSVRFPFLGEYTDAFTGEEFATWLAENVAGFGGNLDMAEEAAKELTERDKVLRRIGEFGNRFENSSEAYYQFRPKAFDMGGQNATRSGQILSSPTALATPMPLPARIVKRSGTLANFFSSALATSTGAPPYLKARSDALAASQEYRAAVRKLDRRRLGLEERIEETLKTLQRWEADRLNAVKTVLTQYQNALKKLHPALALSDQRSGDLIMSFNPTTDLTALIERYRTGPFRPTPQKFESVGHNIADVVFGIDLSSWAGEGGWNAVRAMGSPERPRDTVPPVLRGLLTGLDDAYKRLPSDVERRKSWIYEVPLPAVHHLRESINALPPDSPLPEELLAQYDAPVLAGTLRLWLLELDPPVTTWEGWDEVRKVYPSVGADGKMAEVGELAHIDDIKTALQKMPRVNLNVLNAVVLHLRNLIQSTDVEESQDIYVTKLALSMGRSILRPKVESEMAIQDRHPALFFVDLIKYYNETLPPVISKKKRESERPMPVKKRTAPVDQRMSRGRISALGLQPQQLIESQLTSRSSSGSVTAPPPMPPIPTGPAASQVDQAAAPPPPSNAPAAPPVSSRPSSPRVPEHDPHAPPPRPMFLEPHEAALTNGQGVSGKGDTEHELFISPPTPVKLESPELSPEHAELTESPATIIAAQDVSAEASTQSPPPPAKPQPPSTDQVIAQASATLSRSTSTASTSEASRTRGPRPARGPRAPPGGPSRQGSISLSGGRPPPRAADSETSESKRRLEADPHDYAPKGKRGSRAPAGIFSRRTMASGSEDEVVEK